MSLVQLREITKSYPGETLFQNISLQIDREDRIGLIGDNGTGKSTLMKIITGQEHFDSGEVLTINDFNFGYLSQEFKLDNSNNLLEEMLEVYSDLAKLERKIKQLETEMANNVDDLERVMKEYGKLREKYEQQGGYEYESKIKKVLFGLGFSESDLEKKLEVLSGGEKTRAGLAKLLLQEPELLLLDEPGNHLDLAAREWLEEYLLSYNGAVLLISHDRYLLKKLVNKIWELEKGRFEEYKCNYQTYLAEKKIRLKSWQREYEKQQKKIAKERKYIRKHRAGIKSKQAAGREKKLERMEKVSKPPEIELPKLEFKLVTESGRDVLEIKNLAKSYDDELIFAGVDLRVYKGQKIGVVGPNGSGKSTFLKVLLKEEPADKGEINYGANLKIGCYDQQHQDLDTDNNLIEEMQKVTDKTVEEIRNFLGSFLFTGQDTLELVSTLSGGEKSRLSLAKLAVQDLNLLVMDEPTNHLDIKSREILEQALEDYFGTIIVISHDRYFLDRLAERILAFRDGEVKKYEGNYSYYRRKYQQQLAEKRAAEKVATEQKVVARAKKKDKNENNQLDLAELESKIMELETDLEEIEEQLNQPEVIADQEKLNQLSLEYQKLKEELDSYYSDWEEII